MPADEGSVPLSVLSLVGRMNVQPVDNYQEQK